MRPPQKSNRARGRGSRKPNGNVVNRVFESAGPDGKVRGTPQQIVDKYLSLARDAQTSGDRVMAENFLQHAEHYQRILLEALAVREQRRDNGPVEQPAEHSAANPAAVDAVRTSGEAMTGRGSGGRSPGPTADGERLAHEAEVSGLTTIDPGQDDSGSLLVETEDLSASQPPRRRRSRGNGPGETPTPGESDVPSK